MKTKKLVFATLLITLGLILNVITPGFLGLMKPDFLLAFYLIALCTLENVQERIVVIVICAIMSSITSLMPGAQIVNGIEKVLTGMSITTLYRYAKNSSNTNLSIIIGGIGTLLSGFYFLIIMTQLGFIEDSMVALFMSVVLPTTLTNIFLVKLFLRGFKSKLI